MKKFTKVIALVLSVILVLGMFASCKKDGESEGITLVYANHQLAESEGTAGAITKMVDLYLKTNKKGVTNIEVINPGKEYAVYYQTQFMGDTQPDIGSGLMGQLHEYYANGSIVDMAKHFQETTPYVGDGTIKWEESMADNLLLQVETANGENPCIPYAIGANKLAYNPDLLAKYGVKPPETWTEFIAVCGKIEEQGGESIAFGAKDGGNLHWPMRVIMDSITEEEMAKVDENNSYFVDLSEFCKAVDNGVIDLSKDPWKETYRILNEYKEYWYPGATSMGNVEALEKFAKGETAFMHCAIWMLKNLITNPERKFEVGVVRMPALTTDTSSYADGLYHNLGGLPNANLWISSSLEGKKLEAAVDFVKFITGEECAKILADEMFMIPVLSSKYMPKTEGPVSLFGLDYVISRFALYDATLGNEFIKAIYSDVQPMIIGKITADEAAVKQQESLKAAVTKIKNDNGWTKENNYGRN